MSKVLKVIVNLFLVCAILIAAGVLIPPLLGVSTTVIDSSSMDTNLSVGSVTYSKEVDATAIKVGDKILKESDNKIYAYAVEEADAPSGEFSVVDGKNAQADPEKITLRNAVPKIVITVPIVGYIMMAMHSVEGLIIIGLVVLFIIILFILSELWKKSDGGEDEEEDLETQVGEAAFFPLKEASAEKVSEADQTMDQAKEELAKAVAEAGQEDQVKAEEVNQEEPKQGEAEAIGQDAAPAEEIPEEETEPIDKETFIPVERLSAKALLKKAEAEEEQPRVIKDDGTNITILDYSDII